MVKIEAPVHTIPSYSWLELAIKFAEHTYDLRCQLVLNDDGQYFLPSCLE